MMQTQIVSLLNGWILEMLTECGRTKVSRFSVAGNTVMCHLLMGISPAKWERHRLCRMNILAGNLILWI